MEQAYDKSFDFSVRIIELVKYLDEEKRPFPLSERLITCATGIGIFLRLAGLTGKGSADHVMQALNCVTVLVNAATLPDKWEAPSSLILTDASSANENADGAPAWGKASLWAAPELQKTDEYGLIPSILRGADMTKPITREEFCELALLLYEKTTGKSPAPVSSNPFTDTQNPQILKAFALGITKGTSETTFSPNKTITRQECATMLYRTIRAIKPDADYSISGVPDFPDQKDIDSWAVEDTKYMSKLGIIKGDARGYFMPKAMTTAQQAAGYGTATREAAVLMSVRTYDVMP